MIREVISIKGKEYSLRYTIRNMIMYEEIAGVPFNPSKTLNVLLFVFCVLVCNNPDFRLGLNEFVDACDEDPSIFRAYSDWMEGEMERRKLMIGEDGDVPADGDKKKALHSGPVRRIGT